MNIGKRDGNVHAMAAPMTKTMDPDAIVTEEDSGMLREDLVLCRNELAALRRQLEPLAEEVTRLSRVEKQCQSLSSALARQLSAKPSGERVVLAGWRGAVVRRLAGNVVLTRERQDDPQIQAIRTSKLFDGGWYLRAYDDLAAAGVDPAAHYFHHGARELRAAGPAFDTAFYVSRYPDVLDSGLNPLLHFLQVGKDEGRIAVRPRDAKPGPLSGTA